MSSVSPVHYAVHPAIRNKPVHWQAEFASDWRTLEGTLDQLRAHVTSGGAFVAAAMSSQHRSSAAFRCADLAVVDVDNGLDLDAFAQHPLAQHACFVYTTHSHRPEAPRYRVIFRLPSRMEDPDLYKAIITILTTALGGDRSCTDPCRIFYGSDRAEVPHWVPDAALPISIIEDARAELYRQRNRRAEERVVDDETIDQAVFVLENILEPTIDGQRDRFIKVTAAACSGGEALFPAWQHWATRCHHTSGHRSKQGTERFFYSFRNTRASVATLFYLAEEDHPDWRSELPPELKSSPLSFTATHKAAGYSQEDYMHGGFDNPAFGDDIPLSQAINDDSTPGLFDEAKPWAVPTPAPVATAAVETTAPATPDTEHELIEEGRLCDDPDLEPVEGYDDFDADCEGYGDEDDCCFEDSEDDDAPVPRNQRNPDRPALALPRRQGRHRPNPNTIRDIYDRLRQLYPGLRRNLMNQELEYGPLEEPHSVKDITTAYCRLSANAGRLYPKTLVIDVANVIADENGVHPVQAYLDRCAASVTPCPYFSRLASELLGLMADPLMNPVFTRGPAKGRYMADVILERFFIGAVARALNPGCPHDWMPILIGSQNCGKSNFFQYLTPPSPSDPGVYPWSATIQQGIRNIKEKPHLLHAGWIVVLDETERYFERRYAEEFKNLVSVAVDRSARKYENERNFQRAFVMGGAANSDDFFVDPTGNRRFMPIVVAGKVPSPEDPSTMIIDLDRLKRDRDAIWAAAYKAYLDNPVHTFSADENKQMTEYQENFRSDNPFDGRVRSILATQHSGIHHGQSYVTLSDLYKWLDIPVDRHNSVRIAISDALKGLGYQMKRTRIAGEVRRIWVKGSTPTQYDLIQKAIQEASEAA